MSRICELCPAYPRPRHQDCDIAYPCRRLDVVEREDACEVVRRAGHLLEHGEDTKTRRLYHLHQPSAVEPFLGCQAFAAVRRRQASWATWLSVSSWLQRGGGLRRALVIDSARFETQATF